MKSGLRGGNCMLGKVASLYRAKREQLKRSMGFDPKAKAIIWPGISCVCHFRATAELRSPVK